jgi:glycosyltransferase involved in cell wall biosynthesis
VVGEPGVDMMFLEVVMPTFNGERFLAQQVETIYEQTLRPDRLLIRDDGSTDGTIELIESLQLRYGNWIRRLESIEHLGCCASVNVLLSATQAKYVALADQDDLWHPEKLEQSLALLRQMEGIYGEDMPLLVHGDLRLVDADGKPMGHTFFAYQRLDPRRISPVDLAFTNVVTGCTCVMNQSLLAKAMPIPREAIMHDWWLALVTSVFGTIGILKGISIDYRQHGNNYIGAKGVGSLHYLRMINEFFLWNKLCMNHERSLLQISAFACRYKFTIVDPPVHYDSSRLSYFFDMVKFIINSKARKHGPLRSLAFYVFLLIK